VLYERKEGRRPTDPEELAAILRNSEVLIKHIAASDEAIGISLMMRVHALGWPSDQFELRADHGGKTRVEFTPEARAVHGGALGGWSDVPSRDTPGCPALAAIKSSGSPIDKLRRAVEARALEIYRRDVERAAK